MGGEASGVANMCPAADQWGRWDVERRIRQGRRNNKLSPLLPAAKRRSGSGVALGLDLTCACVGWESDHSFRRRGGEADAGRRNLRATAAAPELGSLYHHFPQLPDGPV